MRESSKKISNLSNKLENCQKMLCNRHIFLVNCQNILGIRQRTWERKKIFHESPQIEIAALFRELSNTQRIVKQKEKYSNTVLCNIFCQILN